MSALQLTSERYAPASSTSAPASWARLPHPVKQAIYVAPDSAWLLGSSSLSCCASHDLSACAMLRPGLTEGTIIAGAPAAWPAATAALASQNSLEFATCALPLACWPPITRMPRKHAACVVWQVRRLPVHLVQCDGARSRGAVRGARARARHRWARVYRGIDGSSVRRGIIPTTNADNSWLLLSCTG
jgi:hypothetical protein